MNENPNVAEFCKNTQALRVINCSCLNMVKVNCRGSQASTTDWEKENQPLNKRKALERIKPIRRNSNIIILDIIFCKTFVLMWFVYI